MRFKIEVMRIKLYQWIFRNLLSNLVKYSFVMEYKKEKDVMMDDKDNFINSGWFDGKELLRNDEITKIEELYG